MNQQDKIFERYSRQIFIDEIGPSGQRKIMDAKVLVIGAGGLGAPVISYLAAAGVGMLGLADFDRVELHNLNRHAASGITDKLPQILQLCKRKL